MAKFYVTRWKRKFTYQPKIRYSLRSFHFENYESALNFFREIDSNIYRANLKSFDEQTKKAVVLEAL